MRVWLAVVAVLVLIPLVHAAQIESSETRISLDSEGNAHWNVTLRYTEPVTRTDYYVVAQVHDPLVIVDGAEHACAAVRESIGYSLICENIEARDITYIFTTPKVTLSLNEFRAFNYRFVVTNLITNMSVHVELPLGTVVAEQERISVFGAKPFEPSGAFQGTDGRVIYLDWNFKNPKLGEPIYISIYYEQINQASGQVEQLVVIVLLIGGVAAAGLLYLHSRRGHVKELLPVLAEPERKVIEILLRERKDVDQRLVVKELDYSKSKISRLLKNLESRGIIEKTVKGRTNVLRLKKTVPLAKAEQKTSEQKRVEERVKKLLGKDRRPSEE